MKKTLALILAVVLALGMSVTSFALSSSFSNEPKTDWDAMTTRAVDSKDGAMMNALLNKGDQVPAEFVANLAGKDIKLTITFAGKDYVVNCKNVAKPAAGVMYYSADDMIKLANNAPATVQDGTYTVAEGDYLWSIAQTLLGDGNRYTEIVELNKLESNYINVGQVLAIPAK